MIQKPKNTDSFAVRTARAAYEEGRVKAAMEIVEWLRKFELTQFIANEIEDKWIKK